VFGSARVDYSEVDEMVEDVHVELVVFLRIELGRSELSQDISSVPQPFSQVVFFLFE